MANIGSKITMEVLTIAVGLPVGIVTKRMVERVWVATSADHPHAGDERTLQGADAVSWAVLLGVAMGLADLVTRKGAEEIYRTVLGTKPSATASPWAWRRVHRAHWKHRGALAPAS